MYPILIVVPPRIIFNRNPFSNVRGLHLNHQRVYKTCLSHYHIEVLEYTAHCILMFWPWMYFSGIIYWCHCYSKLMLYWLGCIHMYLLLFKLPSHMHLKTVVAKYMVTMLSLSFFINFLEGSLYALYCEGQKWNFGFA